MKFNQKLIENTVVVQNAHPCKDSDKRVCPEWDYDKKENLRSQLLHTPSLNSLPCIQKERVYILPLYEGQYSGVRTAEGLEHVAKGLYPDIR